MAAWLCGGFSPDRPRSAGAQVAAPLDMQLLSRPQARFQGSARVGQERFAISDASGMLCHYWGVRLPARWCRVSASDLGEGIRQTLLGTCRVNGASAVSGSAGLEVRGY